MEKPGGWMNRRWKKFKLAERTILDTIQRESQYKKTLELGYIIALLLVIILLHLSKRYEVTIPLITHHVNQDHFIVEEIPSTRQGMPTRRPARPEVIIPVTEDVLPEDETIELRDLSNFTQPGGYPGAASGESTTPDVLPRPIAEVFPEFPREALKAGAEGKVLLHLLVSESGSVSEIVVLENTTGNTECVVAAKKAAKRNKFIPAQKSGKNVSMWIEKSYIFKAPK